MIQIIKMEFKSLDELVRNINIISIEYEYFQDYDIMIENKNYVALLKFDIPSNYKCFSTLDIAKIKPTGSFHVLDFKYKIELDNKNKESKELSKYIECKIYNDILVEIQGYFGFKDFINFVEIEYVNSEYIQVKLNEFYFSGYLTIVAPKEKNTFICNSIDSNVIYEHIVNVYFQRGYLLDRDGLNEFNNIVKRVCNLINERKLKHNKIIEINK